MTDHNKTLSQLSGKLISFAGERTTDTAPDGSYLYYLPRCSHGNMTKCIFPAGMISNAVQHKTIEEIWYVLSGTAQLWLSCEEKIITLTADDALTIPVGVGFQINNAHSTKDFVVIITTMPPWPGDDEAMMIKGYWQLPRQ